MTTPGRCPCGLLTCLHPRCPPTQEAAEAANKGSPSHEPARSRLDDYRRAWGEALWTARELALLEQADGMIRQAKLMPILVHHGARPE